MQSNMIASLTSHGMFILDYAFEFEPGGFVIALSL